MKEDELVWDNLKIRVLEKPGAAPEFDIDEDSHAVTFTYNGDPIALLQLGIAAGRAMGRRQPIPMVKITQHG